MKVDEYRQILRNLELHYQDFLRDTKNSQLFSSDERMQTENDYKKATLHYEELFRTMEKGESSSPYPFACKSVVRVHYLLKQWMVVRVVLVRTVW